MALASYSSASPTVGTTEYSLAAASTSLATKTDIGVYSVTLDVNAIAAADDFLLQVYEMGASGGTKRLVDSWPLTGVQPGPVAILPAMGAGFILGNGWDITLKKISGTDRAIPFTIWRVS